MGVDGRMLDGIFTALIVIGALIGVGLVGLIWLIYWLFSHIHWSWA